MSSVLDMSIITATSLSGSFRLWSTSGSCAFFHRFSRLVRHATTMQKTALRRSRAPGEIIRFEISRDGLPLGEVLVPIPGLLPGPIKHLCEGVVVGVQ
ncbi:hypothetical protein HYQ44_012862 [Verticillium longisporum]|nr:hypothetical protein HYQ44_012862 [Verticillium longisporum]